MSAVVTTVMELKADWFRIVLGLRVKDDGKEVPLTFDLTLTPEHLQPQM